MITSLKQSEIEIGKTYGDITVIERTDDYVWKNKNKDKHEKRWLCKCKKGHTSILSKYRILNESRCPKCACTAFEDLTGQRFGMLTVIKRGPDYEYKGGKNTRWYCTCDHDKYYDEEHTKERPFEERQLFLIRAKSLKRNGGAKSCGCLTRFKKTHGLSKDPLYSRHRGMMRRCKKGKNPHPNYAGRGIEVCEEWANKENGVVNFCKWAHENGYDGRLTIDRIDNDGNYSPENCRWATDKVQSNNKRTNHRLTYNGETHTITEWGEITGLGAVVIFKRIEKGWSTERALTTPIEKNKYYLNIDGKEYTTNQCSLMTGIDPSILYKRIHSATKDGLELTDEVIHNIVFTPPKNTGCMNGVYFVDDDGYPTKPPEKPFVKGVTFLSDEEVEEYKKSHPNLFS